MSTRSTQKEVASLLREVRQLIDVRTNQEAFSYINNIKDSYAKRLKFYGFGGVQVSPYRHGCWTVSALGEGGRWVSVGVSAESLIDSPKEVIRKMLV